ncbi:MAG TPA: TIGR03435 family protein, partial [Bryobacteraceae bacterium]|nr:TIGR03435 family protein [Bryobacteraceae bacterium]
WANSDRFDIEARAEGNPSEAELKLMLQSLLEDRFKLQVHREMRDLPAFNLVAAKGGVKVKLSQEGSCVVIDPFNPPPTPPAGPPGQPHCGNNLISANGLKTDWTAVNIDMAGVAGALTAITRRRVIDKTGFNGNFDLHLQWTNDPAISDAAGDDTGPSFFTILQDELGLKLEPTKTAAEVLVIDHVERPDAN